MGRKFIATLDRVMDVWFRQLFMNRSIFATV